jgi:polysaccharide pyruvyl transferase WcaK-like protein
MISRRTAFAALAGAPAVRSAGQPSILLLSGWNLYNIGDVAHTPGFLQLCERHFPEARVTLLAASYTEEIRRYLQPRFPSLQVLPMYRPGQPLSAEVEAAFAGASLVVLNSGMTLSYGYYGTSWDGIMPRLIAFMKARKAGIPFGIFGHSFDRVDAQANVVYSDILSSAAFIYTRDSASAERLRAAGVTAKELAFGPDAAFGFDWRDSEKGEAFLRTNNLEPGRFLAVIPRLDVQRFRNDGRERIHAEQTREWIVRWVRETGLRVATVHEVARFIGQIKAEVYDPLPADVRSRVVFRETFWMPDEAQHVYANAMAVISAEMHSVILGLAAGTPALHPYFAEAGLKQWMMKDLGCREWMFDQDTSEAAAIVPALLAIARDPASAREKAGKARLAASTRQAEMMATVKSAALGRRPAPVRKKA